MTLIKQFRRAMLCQIAIGIAAFGIAVQDPVVCVGGVILVAIGWLLTERPKGWPAPQWLIAIGALGVLFWLATSIQLGGDRRYQLILSIGYFTLWLQVLLMFGKKSNREYAELMVLSLMVMICGSVLTVLPLFAVLIVPYAASALVAVLLFQLKVTHDQVAKRSHANAPNQAGASPPTEVVTDRHASHFRRLAVMIAVFAVVLGSVAFIAIPRRDKSNFNRFKERQVDFASEIHLDGAPIKNSDNEAVATVELFTQGQPVSGLQGYLLRGTVLDRYNSFNYSWERSPIQISADTEVRLTNNQAELVSLPADRQLLEARISVHPTRDNVLFTLFPAHRIESAEIDAVGFNRFDLQMQSPRRLRGTVTYTVYSPLNYGVGLIDAANAAGADADQGASVNAALRDRARFSRLRKWSYARNWQVNAEDVRAFTQSILDSEGLSYNPSLPDVENDQRVLEALVRYLRSNYEYELNAFKPVRGRDPIIDFLFIHRKGHCEYFASGLVAMTRSIGMRSRVISGYRVSEYNKLGGYYVVRRNDAHAWAEVMVGDISWKVADPTPPALVELEHTPDQNWLKAVDDALSYFEFGWFNSFNDFGSDEQQRSLAGLSRMLDNVLGKDNEGDDGKSMVAQLFTGGTAMWRTVLIGLMCLLALTLVVRAGLGAWRRHRLIHALNLQDRSGREQRRIAAQLEFYLKMHDMLDRHGYDRPLWQTPQAFAQALVDDEPARFAPMLELTQMFYEVRFGGRDLDRAGLARADELLVALHKTLRSA